MEAQEDQSEDLQIGEEINVTVNENRKQPRPTRIIIAKHAFMDTHVMNIHDWCLSGKDRIVLFEPSSQTFFELKRANFEYGSWYADGQICSSRSMVLSSALDPLFIVLHFLSVFDVLNHSTVDQTTFGL